MIVCRSSSLLPTRIQTTVITIAVRLRMRRITTSRFTSNRCRWMTQKTTVPATTNRRLWSCRKTNDASSRVSSRCLERWSRRSSVKSRPDRVRAWRRINFLVCSPLIAWRMTWCSTISHWPWRWWTDKFEVSKIFIPSVLFSYIIYQFLHGSQLWGRVAPISTRQSDVKAWSCCPNVHSAVRRQSVVMFSQSLRGSQTSERLVIVT